MNIAKIPKTIHYCWLSGDKMPNDTVKCMESWKRHMPDYKLVLWDMNRFDKNSHSFVKEACAVKKWAFASDYIRLYALYTEGGIYLDTDVFVKKSFDIFLDNDFFSAVEYHDERIKDGIHMLNDDGTLKDEYKDDMFTHGIWIQAAIMGGVKGHPFLKSCLDWYDDKRFIWEDKTFGNKLIAPCVYAHVAERYGFRYKNEEQKLLHGMTIYPNTIFAGNGKQAREGNYAIHCCNGSWLGFKLKTKKIITHNNFIRKLFGKKKIQKKFENTENARGQYVR